MSEEELELGRSIDDYIDILRRRKFLMLFTTPVVLIVGLIFIMQLPPIYQSHAVILIQGQEIPDNLIKSTVNEFAEQQIEVTRQRLMSSPNVVELIDKYDLYRDIRATSPVHELVKKFKSSVMVNMISAEVPGKFGRKNKANVAFNVSFFDGEPEKAQAVTNELATLFLEENVKSRTTKADETAKFLEEEADRMQAQVQDLENKIAEFKVEYGDSLPEMLEFNLSTVERIESQIIDNKEAQVKLSDQLHSLNIELSNISPYEQFSSGGSGASTPRQRLMNLRAEYAQLSLQYAESHPDIVRLKDEIATTEKAIKQTQSIEVSDDADNPVYRQLKFRIDSVDKDLNRLKDRKIGLEESLIDYQERVKKTHQVKRGYIALTRDYENKLAKYGELRAKQLEANVAQNMEAENKAGSFKLIEPPIMPIAPVKPNKVKLLLMVIVLSFGLGVGLMVAAEFLSPGVRTVAANAKVFGVEPLAVVPHIYNMDDIASRQKNRQVAVWAMLGVFLVGIAIFHFFILALDVLWIKVADKVSFL